MLSPIGHTEAEPTRSLEQRISVLNGTLMKAKRGLNLQASRAFSFIVDDERVIGS
jgi:hypothetical protein